MKKFILSAALLFAGLAQAQLTITGNDQEIAEGQTFIFNTLNAQAALHLQVINETEEPVYIQLKVNSITNADGSEVQFCFGEQCYFDIEQNDVVPTGAYLTQGAIEPGETNPSGDKFLNSNPGTVSGQDVIYNLSFLKVTNTGSILETLVTFNYKYSPTASVDDFTALKNMGVTLSSTVVKSQLDVTADDNVTMELYNINGQIVKTATVAQGTQAVDLSSLSAAVYIASFTTQDNRTSKIRIVKN